MIINDYLNATIVSASLSYIISHNIEVKNVFLYLTKQIIRH